MHDRPRSRPGPRSRPRPHPFTELEFALRTLIRFHESHPDWFPVASVAAGPHPPSALPPEWEEAIRMAYNHGPVVSGNASPASEPQIKT